LDPLDPITEIISSGQGFSPFIALERILWLFIGFFFLGAILSSFIRWIKQQNWFINNLFFLGTKNIKQEDKISKD